MSETPKSDPPQAPCAEDPETKENFEQSWNRSQKKAYEEYKARDDSKEDVRDKLKNRGFTP